MRSRKLLFENRRNLIIPNHIYFERKSQQTTEPQTLSFTKLFLNLSFCYIDGFLIILLFLGKFYSYMALKIVLATILQKFRVEADGKLKDIKLKQDISIRFRDDQYPIRLYKR